MPNATFDAPLVTAGLAGFPDSVSSITEARACIETVRLPTRRSQPIWLSAHQALTRAQVSRLPADVAARIALTHAIASERHDSPPVLFQASALAA